jgi:hypothetical protein
MRDQVFISYSHQDALWLKRLNTGLTPSIRNGKVVVWDDTQINPGADWRKAIERALDQAIVAVLLVSPDFLASNFIAKRELPNLLEAAKNEDLRILWIAVRPSVYKDTPLEAYQAINNPERPLSSLKRSDAEKELVRICSQIKSLCPPPPIEETTRTAGEAIKQLIELMRDPTVQKSVATFRAVFKTSSTQIDIVGHYKELHDSLHTLQFQCYNYIQSIVRNAKKNPEDPTIWDDVYQHEATVQSIVDDLTRFAREDVLVQAFGISIQSLIDDLRILFEAISNCNAEQIEKALRPISKILNTLPTRINERLDAAARGIYLPNLVDALIKVRDNLNKFDIDSARRDKFEKGVAALTDLNVSLILQIESHTKWQEIDVELRPIEAGIARDLTELEESWPDLKRMVEDVCAGESETWARALTEDGQKLEEALSLNDSIRIRQSFQRYRSRVGSRFYQVDFGLKELCGKLHRVGDPLTTVLEMT